MDVEDLPIIITDYPAQDGARKFINESKMSLSMLLSNPSGRSKPSFEPTVGPLLGSGLFASLNDSVLTGTGSRKRSQIDSGLLSMLPRTTLGLSNCIPQLSDSSGSLSKKRKFPTDEFSDLTRKASVLERECRCVVVAVLPHLRFAILYRQHNDHLLSLNIREPHQRLSKGHLLHTNNNR